MAYKLVLFDFDGTLADSFAWFLGAINRVAGKHGFKRIDAHDVDALRGLSGRQMMAHLGLPLWKVPLVAGDMRRLMAESAGDIRLFDGVDRLLAHLQAHRVETAVVTSNVQDNVLRILGSENAARIRHFECGASIFGKAARFRAMLRRTGFAPDEVLCVGDEIRDAQAAAAAGLDFVGVSWGYTHPEALSPHSVRAPFRSVDEMTEVLCSRIGGQG